MANRDLLKEAIADAKAVKETAIANAKAALEEAFNPIMRERLAAKIAEMDEMEEEADLDDAELNEDSFTSSEKAPQGYGSVKVIDDYSDDSFQGEEGAEEMTTKTKMTANPKKAGKFGDDGNGSKEIDEVDLEELLRELDELEEDGFGKFSSDGTEGFSTGIEGDDDTPVKALDEAEGEEDYEDEDADGIEDSEDEEIDLENMSEDDLKNFIEGVIADMVATGELEGGHEGTEDEESEEIMGAEMMAEMKKMKKEVEEAKKAKEKAEKELKEALSTVSTIRTELQEVNLFNAKLLYTNKIFKAKNLTESQKVKVLEAFDKAASVKEAKLVYETLSSGVAKTATKPMNESLIKGGASKPAGVAEKKPIMEANDQVARWQKLAGIK
jgi:hypothetical protein